MRNLILPSVKNASTLIEVKDGLITVLKKIRVEKAAGQIGYVSGIITSDGPDNIERN